MSTIAEKLLATRSSLYRAAGQYAIKKSAEEGGCGVTGFACTIPLAGRFIYEPSIQMQNRGNGKGGGIAHSLRKDLKNHPGTTPFASSCNPAFMLFMIDIIRK